MTAANLSSKSFCLLCNHMVIHADGNHLRCNSGCGRLFVRRAELIALRHESTTSVAAVSKVPQSVAASGRIMQLEVQAVPRTEQAMILCAGAALLLLAATEAEE